MIAYMFDVLYCHQRDLLLILYARGLKYSIPCFIFLSIIRKLVRVCYKSLHVTVRPVYYPFLGYS